MTTRTLAVSKVSDVIARDLEARILEGSLKPGDRLSPERELAVEFGVSRPSVREAIQNLVSRGLLTTRQGGGTWVTDRLDTNFSDPWQDMVRHHPNVREDVLEFRYLLEGAAAERAAERATDLDIARLDLAFSRLEAAYAASDRAEQVAADLAFHQAIAEAAHNVMFGHLNASLLKIGTEQIDINLVELGQRPDRMAALMDQHRSIWQAVRAHNAAAAGQAARAHIDYVRQSMAETARQVGRRESAQRRLEGAGHP